MSRCVLVEMIVRIDGAPHARSAGLTVPASTDFFIQFCMNFAFSILTLQHSTVCFFHVIKNP